MWLKGPGVLTSVSDVLKGLSLWAQRASTTHPRFKLKGGRNAHPGPQGVLGIVWVRLCRETRDGGFE